MSSSSHRRARDRRVPVRALLSLGIVLGLGSVGTMAQWTDDAVVSGTTFTSGTLDLKVNNVDAYATTTLGMSLMVPGNSSAEVLTIKNGGTVPMKYTLTGGLSGTNASDFSTASALSLRITTGTRSGSGNSASCTGGSVVYGPTALTNVVSTAIIGTRRGPVAPAATEALCFEITFSPVAPSSLQTKTTTATFTATGTSDVS